MLNCFPPPLQRELAGLDFDEIRDIRLYADRPCQVCGAEEAYTSAYVTDAAELYETAQALCSRMLRLSPQTTGKGFITLRGGHRMGLCGQVNAEGGSLLLQGIGSLCIRVAHAVPGCGHALAAEVRRGGGVLAAGRPGSGKTTLLRDAVRILSDGGLHVGLADERGELAACLEGVPQLDVGARTHVVDGCAKGTALRWLLRAMCPDLLATDELYGPDECRAVREAAACGVPVLATVHAGTAGELCRREGIKRLLREGTIARVVFLHQGRIALAASAGEVLEAACLRR